MDSKLNNIILEFKGIEKAFPGVLALDNISFQVRRGEVQGLVGENGAGKSTLIKILCGVYASDKGEIWVDGEKVFIQNPADAQKAGIQVMHQEISVIPEMTVAENIWMYHLPRRGKLWVNDKKMNQETDELLKSLGMSHIHARQRMSELSLADQQMTNLARIMSTKPKVVLLDEPTATLTMDEAEKLFEVIRTLKATGVAILYISHYIDEVMNICDRITVLRDGKYIITVNSSEVTNEEIVTYMVGKKVNSAQRSPEKAGEEILRLENVSTARKIKYLNLSLRRREVLGLYGLNGAGKTETLRAIAGIDPLLTGRIQLFGTDVSKESSISRIEKGLVYAPEDRRRLGLVMQMSVQQNVSLGNEKRYARGMFMQGKKEITEVAQTVKRMLVRTASLETSVSVLSGGNQQKVILARCLEREAKIFLMDEPTVGIDVGARAEIYQLISNIVKEDAAVLIASSDLNEILEVCDRAAIITNGRIVAVMDREEMKQEKMLLYAMGDKE